MYSRVNFRLNEKFTGLFASLLTLGLISCAHTHIYTHCVDLPVAPSLERQQDFKQRETVESWGKKPILAKDNTELRYRVDLLREVE